jgi:hypothetical protein
MLSDLGRVERLVGHAQGLGVVLLLSDYELPKIDGTGDAGGVGVIETHAVDVAVVRDAPHIDGFWGVGEEAHSLEPSVPEGLVDCDGNPILGELVEDRSQNVHACIFPESALVVEQFVADDVGHSRQFAVGTLLVELH